MKRCISIAILLVLAFSASAQSWTALTERLYKHNAHYDIVPETLVAIEGNQIHPEDISVETAIAMNGERFFYIYSETTNQLDFFSKIFLGTDAESAIQTLRDFRAMLDMPNGTRDTIENDGYKCFLLVCDDSRYGKLLVTRRINDGGTVTFNDVMLDILEDALEGYDEASVSCFPHYELSERNDIKSEVARYKALASFVIPFKDIRFCYTPEFYDMFRLRIKEYKADLRALKR